MRLFVALATLGAHARAAPSEGYHDWPYRRDGPPDAWILWLGPKFNLKQQLWNFRPGLLTVADGLHRAAGASVALTDVTRLCGPGATRACDDVAGDVRAVADAGGRAVIVAFDWWNPSWAPAASTALDACAAAGALVVIYNSEPTPGFPSGAPLHRGLARRWNASEVWDYSRGNLEFVERRGHWPGLARRYVPPSYVDAYDWLGAPAAPRSGPRPAFGFLGTRGLSPRTAFGSIVADVGGTVANGRATSWSAIRSFLRQRPLQLVHHRPGPGRHNLRGDTAPFEAFRAAVLAAGGACVVSERSHAADESAWAPVVAFVHDAAAMRAFLDGLAGDGLAACANRTQRVFRERFDAADVLRASGFLDAYRRRAAGGFERVLEADPE